jgi:hypothetical protein
MLKRSVILLLLAVSATPLCDAQKSDIDEHRTGGLLNGRFWKILKPSDKLIFVVGYCEASVGPYACPTQSEFGEIVDGVERFYQDPENLSIPFVTAERVFAMKVAGATTAEIETIMNLARKNADTPPPKK